MLCEECPRKLNKIALPDRFLESGTPRELAEKFGLVAERIASRVIGEMTGNKEAME